MSKFSSKPNIAPLPALEKDTTEEDKAADRLRLSEKRRRGRRASILSKIGEEEIGAATFGRPAGRSSKKLFGG